MGKTMQINITEYLDTTAARSPQKIAFSDTVTLMTFSELRDTARKIATRLLKITDNAFKKPIAVFMEKSPQAIAANFAVVYSGNYYVSLDREMPLYRIEKILESLQPAVIICDDITLSIAEQLDFGGICCLYSNSGEYEQTDETALAAIRERTIDLDPVYVVFTSGSSGMPKGVTACHRSVIDYIENLSQVLQVNDTTVFGNQAPLYVDACLKEVCCGIKTGATTMLIPKDKFMFPVKLIEFLNEYKINTICWVSSALSLVAGFKTFVAVKPEHLHTIVFGSELFPVKNLNIWREALPDAKFINLYGPTEATGMSSYYEVPANKRFAEDERIPIGKAFRNTEILLIDGEICIRGTCLSLGYYNDFGKTAESFTQNPHTTTYPDLVYRTGDLGGYNTDGELVYIARKDYQIKHMGYRIELPEIEAAFCQHGSVALACCLYDDARAKIILCYIGDITPAEATAYLKTKLPRYMLPNRILVLEQMPLTPNGKIDRTKLKEKLIK
jgi:amino acid adenylation domain-containing protein